MSFYVYIARKGFESTPIDETEWLAAARQCANLLVAEERDSTGRVLHSLHLPGNKRKRLARTSLGLICAQDPNRELIAAMFQLAERLNAGVYSERRKPYVSVEDWERRTREYRFHRDKFVRTRRTRQRVQKSSWVFFVGMMVFTGWLFGSGDTPPDSDSSSSDSLNSELLRGEPLTLESLSRYTSNSAPAIGTPSNSSPTDTAATGKP